MNTRWNMVKEVLNRSKYKTIILEGETKTGQRECKKMGISNDSVLASVIMNCGGICIDDWIRILGQGSESQKGVFYYNNSINDEFLNGMFIVGNDVVGGIYAINISRFEIDNNMIWYFAPDTLEWESLEMNYFDFIVWSVQGNINDFYESMRWNNWRRDCKSLEFNMGYLIYPFLWATECDINTANKKVVLVDELINLNFECLRNI